MARDDDDKPRTESMRDVLALQDAYIRKQRSKFRELWRRVPVRDVMRPRPVVDDPVRLKRLKARASGIRFALRYDDLSYRQRKEMEQTLKNLDMAIEGLDRILRAKNKR